MFLTIHAFKLEYYMLKTYPVLTRTIFCLVTFPASCTVKYINSTLLTPGTDFDLQFNGAHD